MARIYPLFAMIFTGCFGYGCNIPIFTTLMIHPVNPKLIGLPLSSRLVILGALLAAFPFGQFIGGTHIGTFSDHYGRKKVILVCQAVVMTAYLGITYGLFGRHLPLIFTSLFVAGLFESSLITAQNAINDLCHTDEKTVKFGYAQACVSCGYLVGPILAGLVANPSISPWGNVWLPSLFVAGLFLALLIWTAAEFKETSSPTKEPREVSILGNIKTLFTDKNIRFFYGINALIYFALFGFVRNSLVYISDEYRVSVTQLGLYTSYIYFFMLTMNTFLIQPISKRASPYTLLTQSAFFMGIFLFVIPLFKQESFLWLTLALTTIFASISSVSCSVVISHQATPSQHGRAIGNNRTIVGGVQAIATLGGGALAAFYIPLPLYVAGGVSLLATLLLFVNKRKKTS